MPLVPARLPLFAYLAAGAVAFVAGRAITSGAGTGASPAAGAGAGSDSAAGGGVGGGSLWDTFGPSELGGQFTGGGVLPGGSLSDLLGGQPIPVTITDPDGNPITLPIVPPGDSVTPPPPVSSPPPASNPFASYGPKPAGAVGVMDATGVPLYKISGGKAVQITTGSTIHAWVGASHLYPPNATLRKVLSGGHAGSYVKANAGTFRAG